jgi:hypothetical protein
MNTKIEARNKAQRTRALIGDTLGVVLGNAIPAYGVVFWNWPPFSLVALYILEGVVVLAGDYVKAFLRKRVGQVEPNFQKTPGNLLFFETVFILFFGSFAIMVFGPGEEFGIGFITIGKLLAGELLTPFVYLVVIRTVRLAKDIWAAGPFGLKPRAPLSLSGGGWMLLLFFAVMLAPLLARTGPNPKGGLFALVALKTAGELLGVWAPVIDLKLGRRARHRGA